MSDIEATGATLVSISPQTVEHSRTSAVEHGMTSDLLVDTGNKVAERFGIVFDLPDDLQQLYRKFKIDLEEYNGDSSWTLPLPGDYVIDRDQTIRYSDVDPDYALRPEPGEIIAALQGLAGRLGSSAPG